MVHVLSWIAMFCWWRCGTIGLGPNGNGKESACGALSCFIWNCTEENSRIGKWSGRGSRIGTSASGKSCGGDNGQRRRENVEGGGSGVGDRGEVKGGFGYMYSAIDLIKEQQQK